VGNDMVDDPPSIASDASAVQLHRADECGWLCGSRGWLRRGSISS
jgi:hypothetical protein